MNVRLSWVPLLLAVLVSGLNASTIASTRAAPVARIVRGIVARVVPLNTPVPSTQVWVFVLENQQGTGERWISLRVPGRRDPGRMVAVAGFPMPEAGERVRLTVRTKVGSDWLLSLPQDWEPLDAGSSR